MITRYLLGAAVLSLGAAPVAAQVVTSRGEELETAPVQEIVVTAQKREENVQDIPVAVAVVSGEALIRSNATNIADLTTLVPSLSYSAGNEMRNNSIRIRGVGTDVFSVGVEPSISTVLDGVVLQRPGAAFSDLGDIQRVEVLRGPQGTLFGKNSSAGVISIVTKDPSFSGFEGEARFLLAEDNEYRASGVVSGPLAEGIAFRLAAFYRTQDGIVFDRFSGDTFDDQEAYGARFKLGVRAIDGLNLMLSADYAKLDATCCSRPYRIASTNPRTPPSGIVAGPNNAEVNNDVVPYVRQENYGGSVTADLDIGGFTLTSITAYREFKNASDQDLDGTPARIVLSNANTEDTKTFTQEIRLTSPNSGVLDYVIGAYYFDGSVLNTLDRKGLNLAGIAAINSDGSIVPRVPGDLAVLAGFSQVDTRNMAVFGQANLHIGDRLTLTGGIRYLDEKIRLRFNRPLSGFFNGSDRPATNPALGPLDRTYTDDALIGKASATFEFTNLITGYASYSTGYKSLGLAATLGLTQAQFNAGAAPPEESELFEVGLKTELLDRRLLLNITGFRTRFTNYQAQTFNSTLGLVTLTSAGGVGVDGVELEFTARPSDQFTVTGGVTYLNARYTDVPNGPCYPGQTAAQGCVTVGGVASQNLNGKPFVNAPDWRVTLSPRYEFPLSDTAKGRMQVDLRWQDDAVYDINQDPNLVQDAYEIVDASIGASFADDRFDLSVFVKNLFDQQYVGNINAAPTFAGNGYVQLIPRDFRRYFGATLRARF